MPKSSSKKVAGKSPSLANIPGMFYDKSKKKYFSIRNTNDSSVPYSTGYIKALEAREEREQIEKLIAARQSGQVKRSKILESPLAGGLLSRSHGAGRANKINSPAILANGLTEKTCHQLQDTAIDSGRDTAIFQVIPKADLGATSAEVYIAIQNSFYMLKYEIEGPEQTPSLQINQDLSPKTCFVFQYHFPHSGPSTSISYNAAYEKICMTWLAGASTTGIAVMPTLNLDSPFLDHRGSRQICTFGPGYARGRGEVDIWCSTAPPQSSPYLFVFGTSHGLLGIDKSNNKASYITFDPEPLNPNLPCDTLAIEYLPDNPNILLCGRRSGHLNITDLRVRDRFTKDIIYHRSGITHIKAVDSHRIVVAGMRSKLCQYDLRSRKLYGFSCDPDLDSMGITIPTVEYPEYHNESSQFLGFDVDVEAGIIAAAQEGPNHHKVLLYDLHGGHTINSPLLSPPIPAQPSHNHSQARCLRFVEDRRGGAKSIWLSQPTELQRYFW